MFAGYKFSALGEAKSQNVKNAIESYGGRMVNGLDEEVDFIIVRLVRYAPVYIYLPLVVTIL
jgi:DNA replication regulator DPB11